MLPAPVPGHPVLGTAVAVLLEACPPKERWTPVGKHLGAISSTCYLESGSWNRVGRNKADSVLSLINDCWDRGAGAGLARRYRGVTSGQECAAWLWGFCCAGLRESPAPCCCFPVLYPFPSLALGRVMWQRILLWRAGGMVVVVLLLVVRVGALLASLERGFLAPCGLSLAGSPVHGCARASASHLWLEPW